MADQHTLHVLTLNSGSSSVNCVVCDGGARRAALCRMERIRLARGCLSGTRSRRHAVLCGIQRLSGSCDSVIASVQLVLCGTGAGAAGSWASPGAGWRRPSHAADGHPEAAGRVAGTHTYCPGAFTKRVKAIHAVCRHYPELPQVACFDTAFHRQMPAVAQMYALPRPCRQHGLIRAPCNPRISSRVCSGTGARNLGINLIYAHLDRLIQENDA